MKKFCALRTEFGAIQRPPKHVLEIRKNFIEYVEKTVKYATM